MGMKRLMKKLPNIYGFNKTSEAGHNVFAPSIFLKGCNLRCPYCMNARLVKNERIAPLNIEEIKQYVLKERCEWIMLSGGEPTVTPVGALIALINELKSWGCMVGMSTNGNMPEILKKVLPLVNYVALDFKCARSEDISQIASESENMIPEFNKSYGMSLIRSHVQLIEAKLHRKDFDYEVRTTLYPLFIDKKAIEEIGSMLRSDCAWILQQFRHNKNMLSEDAYNVTPYEPEEVDELLKIAKTYCKNVRVRYV